LTDKKSLTKASNIESIVKERERERAESREGGEGEREGESREGGEGEREGESSVRRLVKAILNPSSYGVPL
jgi:hypothetical protein